MLNRGLDVRALPGGVSLEPSVAARMARRFRADLSAVRVHSDPVAIAATRAAGARAMTHGSHIAVDPAHWRHDGPASERLLAHELSHVLQFSSGNGTVATRGALESQAESQSRAGSGGPPAAWARAELAVGWLHDKPKPGEADLELPEDPFSGWSAAPQTLLLIQADDKLYVVPAGKAAFTPTAKALESFRTSSAHYGQDLGTLFEVPASGASGTRVFQAGRRSALVMDAGYDVAPGQRQRVVAVYLDEVMGIARQLGITKISKLIPIHAHGDHVVGIPALVSELQIKAGNLIVPEAYRRLGSVDKVVRALSGTTDAGMVAKGFGAGWTPQGMPKDKGGPGDLYRGSMMVGDLVVEMVALRSALKDSAKRTDLASYLTRVTRRTDNAKVVLLGDLRGADLERIRNGMETHTTGSWAEFFRGVKTLSGFSHHLGRMEAGDKAGTMALLEATLLTTGKLNVVEQTNRGVFSAARRDTLDLAARLGIPVAFTDMPAGNGSTPSAAGSSRDSLSARGPAAVVQAPLSTGLTSAVARIESLALARQTIEQWRPWLEEINGSDGRSKIDKMVAEIDSSMTRLRTGVTQAASAAIDVRTEARPTGSTGSRTYGGTSGAGKSYADAEAAIAAQTSAERLLDAKMQAGLQELRSRSIEQIPLSVALYRAVTTGEFSDQAFRHMLGALDPMTRNQLLKMRPGTLDPRAPRHVAFERVRRQFTFETELKRSMGQVSISSFSTPMRRAGGRGVGGLLLVAELWNSVGQPLVQSHQISKSMNVTKNLRPFAQRIAFWQQFGINPSFEGVEDPTFGSPSIVTDRKKVVELLADDDLDAIYIKSPALTDEDITRLTLWLMTNIRNYDEYAEIFEDSFQDAVRFDLRAKNSWADAVWQVRVGYYETEGDNHVVTQWIDHARLTELMRRFVPWLIANTGAVLEQASSGQRRSAELEQLVGTMGGVPTNIHGDGPAPKKMRLRDPAVKLIVEVPQHGQPPANRTQNVLAELSIPGTAEFLVVGERGSGDNKEWRVTGANFNTYAAIRDLKTFEHQLNMGADARGHGRTWTSSNPVGNDFGTVWVDAVHLVEVSPEKSSDAGQADPPSAQPGIAPSVPSAADLRRQQSSLPSPGPRLKGPADAGGLGGFGPVGPKVFGPAVDQPGSEDKSRWVGPGISIPFPLP